MTTTDQAFTAYTLTGHTTVSRVEIVHQTSTQWEDSTGGLWDKHTRRPSGASKSGAWGTPLLFVPDDDTYETIARKHTIRSTITQASRALANAARASDDTAALDIAREAVRYLKTITEDTP